MHTPTYRHLQRSLHHGSILYQACLTTPRAHARADGGANTAHYLAGRLLPTALHNDDALTWQNMALRAGHFILPYHCHTPVVYLNDDDIWQTRTRARCARWACLRRYLTPMNDTLPRVSHLYIFGICWLKLPLL